MALLEQLKITDASDRKDTSPKGRFRRRLADALELQIELAKADTAGTTFNRTRERWVKQDGGGKELRHVPVRIRRWWWKDEKGTIFLSLKCGTKSLELAPGKRAIEVGSIDDLPGKLSILCDAVRAGELDVHAPNAFAHTTSKKTTAESASLKAARSK